MRFSTWYDIRDVYGIQKKPFFNFLRRSIGGILNLEAI